VFLSCKPPIQALTTFALVTTAATTTAANTYPTLCTCARTSTLWVRRCIDMLLTLPKGEISPSQRGSQGPPACSCNISSNPTAKPSQARFLPLRADVVFPCAEPGRSCNLRKIKGCFRIPESSIRYRPLHPVVPVRPFHIVLFLQPPQLSGKTRWKSLIDRKHQNSMQMQLYRTQKDSADRNSEMQACKIHPSHRGFRILQRITSLPSVRLFSFLSSSVTPH